MRRLQRAGHRPLALVGGSTGLIGDPKESGERPWSDTGVVAEWAQRLRVQVSHYLDLDGPAAARTVNNLEWTASLGVLDFLRDIGKHFPVNRMLDRQVVSTRLESGISYTEFSYVLLQSMDYLELYRRYGCVLQTGGSDQWGNITAGVELVRRAQGARVHALATPLVTRADGTKFGKTETGTVWLDPTMTTPYTFFQFWINADDERGGGLPADVHRPGGRGDRRPRAGDGATPPGEGGPTAPGPEGHHARARRDRDPPRRVGRRSVVRARRAGGARRGDPAGGVCPRPA